jgi:hypothetical protein
VVDVRAQGAASFHMQHAYTLRRHVSIDMTLLGCLRSPTESRLGTAHALQRAGWEAAQPRAGRGRDADGANDLMQGLAAALAKRGPVSDSTWTAGRAGQATTQPGARRALLSYHSCACQLRPSARRHSQLTPRHRLVQPALPRPPRPRCPPGPRRPPPRPRPARAPEHLGASPRKPLPARPPRVQRHAAWRATCCAPQLPNMPEHTCHQAPAGPGAATRMRWQARPAGAGAHVAAAPRRCWPATRRARPRRRSHRSPPQCRRGRPRRPPRGRRCAAASGRPSAAPAPPARPPPARPPALPPRPGAATSARRLVRRRHRRRRCRTGGRPAARAAPAAPAARRPPAWAPPAWSSPAQFSVGGSSSPAFSAALSCAPREPQAPVHAAGAAL